MHGPTKREIAENSDSITKHARNSYKKWKKYCKKLGDHLPEKVKLHVVTGLDLVAAWEMAIFSKQGVSQELKVNIKSDPGIGSFGFGFWFLDETDSTIPVRRGPKHRFHLFGSSTNEAKGITDGERQPTKKVKRVRRVSIISLPF